MPDNEKNDERSRNMYDNKQNSGKLSVEKSDIYVQLSDILAFE